MDNFDFNKIPGPPQRQEPDKPIPLGEDLDKPIPFDDSDTGEIGVSHSPLDLGGKGQVKMPKMEVPKPPTKKTGDKIVSSDRISGVKTFFTKLHPGAIEFLDEQITNWLKENPGVTIKLTNTTTGNVQAKKTEPNIIITVWY